MSSSLDLLQGPADLQKVDFTQDAGCDLLIIKYGTFIFWRHPAVFVGWLGQDHPSPAAPLAQEWFVRFTSCTRSPGALQIRSISVSSLGLTDRNKYVSIFVLINRSH